jgi:hypothetical protein
VRSGIMVWYKSNRGKLLIWRGTLGWRLGSHYGRRRGIDCSRRSRVSRHCFGFWLIRSGLKDDM